MPVVAGAIVPHAPLLLPELESDEVASSAAIVRKAISSIDTSSAEVIVVLSPHAEATGVYREIVGDLAAFGVPDITVVAETDGELIESAAESTGAGIPGPIDHGVTVPLRLRAWDLPIVAFGMEEESDDLADSIARVAGATEKIAEVAPVFLLASVNLSAALSPRAPLTYVESAADAEEALIKMILADVGWLETGAGSVHQDMSSCGAGPLSVFGRLLREHGAEVRAHEAPVGVGYLVAQTT